MGCKHTKLDKPPLRAEITTRTGSATELLVIYTVPDVNPLDIDLQVLDDVGHHPLDEGVVPAALVIVLLIGLAHGLAHGLGVLDALQPLLLRLVLLAPLLQGALECHDPFRINDH